jgi:hypothetical protein
MATALYKVRSGATATPNGRELLGRLQQLRDAYYGIVQLRAAIIQEKDGVVGDSTDFATPAATFGFTDANDAISPAVAMAAFAEIDSFTQNAGNVLTQLCARFQQ